MRKLSIYLASAAVASAQFIVHDPANTAVNAAVQAGQAANHLAVMRQWAEQVERMERQLRWLEEQLSVQRRIRDAIGDPAGAGAQVVLRDLGAEELARSYGETLQAVRRLATAVRSLERTADGIYASLEDRTVLGRDFRRQEQPYRRYAAVEGQLDQLVHVHEETSEREQALQRDVADVLGRLRDAGTQAEVDKLGAKLAALNGQLALLAQRRRDEADKLVAAHLQNENQAAKERQDFLERQLAEERQSLEAVNAWQRKLRLSPANFSRP
jgi:uncharacterized protein (UPF0335 family)